MNKILTLGAAALASALLLSGCGTTQPTTDAAGRQGSKVTLTDATGHRITLDHPATKVIATEWMPVEDLVTLGINPVGISDIKGYTRWNHSAPLRTKPADIGTRGEPSMDTIARLSPDLIVATQTLSSAAVKQMRAIAPVLVLQDGDRSDQVGRMMTNLDQLAKATGTAEQATKAKKDFHAKVAKSRQAIADAGLQGTKVANADGYKTSNQISIRAFTSGSQVGAMNELIGLKSAWALKPKENSGLVTTDVEALTRLGDVPFLYIPWAGKENDLFKQQMTHNALWKSMPFVKHDKVHRLDDTIWQFGGPRSMGRYAQAVAQALTA
ncbi:MULTISPECIES: ABC transporter substrate-binding protein [Streptomyces]|uniref:ABC transporter substrate-binding protein n=1 Tax=Streptomyces TaxID=1883 RepID=UPI00040A1ABE|nr:MULTISPECIES: iron-siderophore ABC transporter substrate-binding protein [unclassified Streptomyces]NEC40886.1 iron-siderophore ABC transporter substrate-binding protein [Streptomyces sp. SID8016]NEC64688.1 iron-siderophore ABC transporter substrate-binding protein [Streptomyces sp. SID9727]